MDGSSILVIGKNGQLGSSILDLSNNFISKNIKFVDRKELDLLSISNIESFFVKNKFDIIINCAAYTAVDKAEEEVKTANLVNNIAIKYICNFTKSNNSTIIHISTDYVFDGKKLSPYSEKDNTNPLGIYGETKLNGEKKLQKYCDNFIIFRTSWVYSAHNSNFVKSIIKIAKENTSIRVVDDEIGSPTSAIDLAGAIINLINSKKFKKVAKNKTIINYSNKGKISRYEFAKEIISQSNINCEVEKIKSINYKTIAKRPKYSVLDTSLYESLTGRRTLDWINSLKKVLNDINK